MHNAVAAIVGVFVGGLYFQVDTTISGFQVSLALITSLLILIGRKYRTALGPCSSSEL